MKGEFIHDENKMLKGLDSLIIGVPIYRKNISLRDEKQKQLYDLYIEDNELQKVMGAVYIVTPLEPLEITIRAIKIQFLYIFLGSIVVASIIAFFLSRNFTKPLIKINYAAKEIAKGNYNTRIHLKSSNEITALGETVNNLAKQLSK